MIRRQKHTISIRARKNVYRPESFVLYERASGAVRFRVQAGPDGGFPVEQVAGLLAMHCLVRGQAPADFELMVVPIESLLQTAAARAEDLLAAGRAIGASVKISRREQEVLSGILQNFGNKEIASKLNVSERTVKFHVSSLLAKFGVSDRVALSREVNLSRKPIDATSGNLPHFLFGHPIGSGQEKVQNISNVVVDQATTDVTRPRDRIYPMPRERYAT